MTQTYDYDTMTEFDSYNRSPVWEFLKRMPAPVLVCGIIGGASAFVSDPFLMDEEQRNLWAAGIVELVQRYVSLDPTLSERERSLLVGGGFAEDEAGGVLIDDLLDEWYDEEQAIDSYSASGELPY